MTNQIVTPLSLYEISLNQFCESLYKWSQQQNNSTNNNNNNTGQNRKNDKNNNNNNSANGHSWSRLIANRDRQQQQQRQNSINLIFSSLNPSSTSTSSYRQSSQWLLSSRPSSTDNLPLATAITTTTTTNQNNHTFNHNLDDKINSFKKSCHNLLGTIFGRKSFESLEEDTTIRLKQQQQQLVKDDQNGDEDEDDDDYEEELSFIRNYYRLTENICQDIIRKYQQLYKLNDRTLSFPLFDGDINTITTFQIEDATLITVDGLKALKKHNLNRIKMSRLMNCTITELINNLSPWSIWNLESFSVPHCSLTKFNKICIILSLTRLTNLVHLDVSYTSFNNQCLEIITDHLVHLKSLDLTATKLTLLKPLCKLTELNRLNLHNVSHTCKDEYILGNLHTLEYLDISDERFSIEPERYYSYDHLADFFPKFIQFERLIELDISGRHISPSLVFQLIRQRLIKHKENSNYRPLKFIGLMSTEFTFTQMFNLDTRTSGRLMITGTGKLIHVINSLLRYRNRPIFIQKALICLCQYAFSDNVDQYHYNHHNNHQQQQHSHHSNDQDQPENEEIDIFSSNFFNRLNDDNDNYEYNDSIDNREILAAESRLQPNEIQPYRSSLIILIIDLMERHMKNAQLILFSSGHLYHFTKNCPNLHPYILRKVINICIETIKHHPSDHQIIKNILLTMSSDRILQDITFDRYTCIRLVMDTLFTFQDLSINRLALAICAILAAKIPIVENALLDSQPLYLKRLLDLVEKSYCENTPNSELILKLSLSALWNFTDEAPKTCETFINNDGIELYMDILILYQGKSNIETKILGLLNNIAEVLHLRLHLIQPKLLHQLRKLIYSDQIDVSYFAIGILAQLASDNHLDWTYVDDFDMDQMLQQMLNQIQSWPNPSFEMVAYRSFEPFISLLDNDRHESISLWALWAIHHVCTKNPNKYCRMLYDEKCITKIINILFERLHQQYRIDCQQQQRQLSHRLINLVTVVDDEFQILCKARTNWNCYDRHQWNIVIEKSLSSSNNESNQLSQLMECQTTVSSEERPSSTPTIMIDGCDCLLKYLLDNDPSIRLPSIILKSFHRFSPIPLNL
ncbi:protein zyg-11 homolog A-like [Dermatophagoides pteronyssinus]|uniref:protein zyg-11 homolog A-like n=1 Tax=Dermatophagoides pteronyssinus TaxID=6956 RepID=UPI003F67AA4E